MTHPALTIDEEEPLWRAARKMLECHIHRLVVTKDGAPVGIIATRDMMAVVRDARVERKLADVVTRTVETIDVDASIDRAVAALAESNVRGLVVVDGDWPVGVFTRLEAIYAQSLPPGLRGQAVEHIMSYETICFDQSTPLYRVAGHAVAMAARRILAVEDRKLVGVATGFDLARVVADVW
jgi:CBS domain-containing protein